MPCFQKINSLEEISLNPSWVDSLKFNSKDLLVDEKGRVVDSDFNGRKYHLVSKKERNFSDFERIKRFFLGIFTVIRSCGFALYSKSTTKLFTETKEKIRFGVLCKETDDNAKQLYDTDYSLDVAVERVKKLSKDLHVNGKKLCLFIGRAPGEPFPGFGQEKPDNETWVSLDISKNINYTEEFIPGKQLHLVMDMNDDENLKKIHKLFDKVIVDFSTLKFHQGEDPWSSFGKLLRPQKDSQLITEAAVYSMIPIQEIIKLMPEEERDFPLYKTPPASYGKAKNLWEKKREEETLNKLNNDNCFSSIKIESESQFPYMYRRGFGMISHLILTGPQEKLWQQPTQ